MDAFLGNKYKLNTSEGFDAILEAYGVGLVTRKMGNTLSPVIELTKDGDKYTFSTFSTFKNTVISFKLGEEFDEETADGRKVKATCTFDGNKFVQKQIGADGKPTSIIREYSDDEVKTVMTYEGLTSTRVYKKE